MIDSWDKLLTKANMLGKTANTGVLLLKHTLEMNKGIRISQSKMRVRSVNNGLYQALSSKAVGQDLHHM